MVSHKNQHYVPRCYLKHFSVDRQGRAINAYNIHLRRGIRNAPVRGQCAEAYFYGEDLRLEKLLQQPEGWYAEVLTRINAGASSLSDEDAAGLRHFCYLQYLRTDAASKRAALYAAELADVAGMGGNVRGSSWRMSEREAVIMALSTFDKTVGVIDDLKVCLVRNDTRTPLVTSDDPAILTNRWYSQNPRAKGLVGGSGSSGALFLLPLTPKIMCVVYDGDVYAIPNAGGWAVTRKVSDIKAFNQHQLLNCLTNVFFHDWADLPSIEREFATAQPLRPAARHRIITAVLHSEEKLGERYRVVPRGELERGRGGLIHLQVVEARPNQWPSLVRFRADPRAYSNGSATGFVRRSVAEDPDNRDLGYERI
jgi:hypothetical protein